MGEKKSRSNSELEKSEKAVTAKPASKAVKPKPIEAKPINAPKSQPRRPLVTFTRWFNARGFRPHWKAGMAVHAGDLKARKTPEEWDEFFKDY